jgi:hypothetical protein
MRSALVLCSAVWVVGAARAEKLLQTQPMAFSTCVATIQELTHSATYSRLLSTTDIQMVRIEKDQKAFVITCDRAQARMVVRTARVATGGVR